MCVECNHDIASLKCINCCDYFCHSCFEELHRNGRKRKHDVENLNFISNDILYGRYWGCNADIKNLHFEVCYYQAMEYAIKNKYIKVEAGAQGAHKIKRGYLPKITYSAHYIFNEKLKLAIKNFLEEERRLVLNDINHINDNYSPFKII